MADLSTKYLGFNLKSPIIASASPLSKKVEHAKMLEDAGVGAIVMYSLFEEEIDRESLVLDMTLNQGAESFPEALSYFPIKEDYNIGPGKYLDHLNLLQANVSVPVIASLNGSSRGGWVEYARKLQDAGADALELNIYSMPVNFSLHPNKIEDDYVELVREVRQQVTIPFAVKLSPFYTSLPHFAARIVEAGADALVLFNRFYQPDIDVDKREVAPILHLSTPYEELLPLRWIAVLYGRVQADLALTRGIHDGTGVVKAIMAGASAAMMASALLKNGINYVKQTLQEVEAYMDKQGYDSVAEMQGSMSQKSVANPRAFERGNYMKVLSSFRDEIKL